MTPTKYVLPVLALLAAGASLAGCVYERPAYQPPVAYGPPPPPPYAGAVAYQPPPPPRVEYQPPPPGPIELWAWAPGYWHWDGHHYDWRQGTWRHRPSPRAEWHPHHWEQRGNGWFLVEGRFG